MKISINIKIKAPRERVWEAWVNPDAITQFYFASQDWTCPKASVNLQLEGTFVYRMEAKDGSMGFDFNGVFTKIKPHEEIEYSLEDGRRVSTTFTETTSGTILAQTFDAEDEYSGEQQKQGWQAILDNFKRYIEQ